MDCAGKHRQYGVMYSFVKSANLDSWTKRQVMFMLKGGILINKLGNARALEYLRKCGAISAVNKTIDYKSAIVQKYK
jgi:ADP-ribosylation factor GTPase-activating protein 2/3